MALTAESVQRAVFKHVGFDVDGRYRPDWHGIKYDFTEGQLVWVEDEPATIQVEDALFGGEGDYNTETYVVFRVSTLDAVKYFQISGWYSSYEGTDWESTFKEVKPLEVKVTKWTSA